MVGLPPPSARVVLESIYDASYNVKLDDDLENIFGTVLYRETEDIKSYHNLNDYLSEFIKYDIGKIFNISVNEYLRATPALREAMILVAEDRQKEIISMSNTVIPPTLTDIG